MKRKLEFRQLTADELEARVATVSANGVSVLIYKNARVDMNILDETVGQLNWQRDHKEVKGRMYCGIGIYDMDKDEWVWKWDCGTESNTEAEKGESSDSFKRAGFCWGIGRELYTAPFVWFPSSDVIIEDGHNGKKKTRDTFAVEEIGYTDRRITHLVIRNRRTRAAFVYDEKPTKITIEDARRIKTMLEETDSDVKKFLSLFMVSSVEDIPPTELPRAYQMLNVKYERMKNEQL